jgi:hypothetical protein
MLKTVDGFGLFFARLTSDMDTACLGGYGSKDIRCSIAGSLGT